mgnify:CR=1 FL=1
MAVEVRIPEVGESITEGFLAEWLQPDGAVVAAEDPLLVLETDKITMNVNAEQAGKLKIMVAEGETVVRDVHHVDRATLEGIMNARPAPHWVCLDSRTRIAGLGPVGVRRRHSTRVSQPKTSSACPVAIMPAARCTACWLDPHWKSSVVPGTSTGSPAMLAYAMAWGMITAAAVNPATKSRRSQLD